MQDEEQAHLRRLHESGDALVAARELEVQR
jgi:hypothetical protein